MNCDMSELDGPVRVSLFCGKWHLLGISDFQGTAFQHPGFSQKLRGMVCWFLKVVDIDSLAEATFPIEHVLSPLCWAV